VPTLRDLAALLAAADRLEHLAPIASLIGCTGDTIALDAVTLRTLGLDDAVVRGAVQTGPGAIRALLAELRDAVLIRDWLPRAAARLASRAPHVLWIVIATHADGSVTIGSWSDTRRPPRVVALMADRARLVDSDAETLRALTTCVNDRDLLTHARWIDILGRDALSNRFYRGLDRAISGLASSSNVGTAVERSELALLHASRLLFLAFLEAKGWLDGDHSFLTGQFEQCGARSGRFHERVLRPLFFGTLNTPVSRRAPRARAFGRVPFLNGGLFSRTPLERRTRVAFSDDAYGELLFDLFGQYRFTAREESTSLSEAAVDPEMLGRAFETLMAARERQRTGAFFTPFSLVERVTNAGLESALGTRFTLQQLDDFAVLDPACGSGAFLVHALERVSILRAGFGDARPMSVIRRDVLVRSIFGVDVNPTAVWLCQLRLWLSAVIESEETDPTAVVPLPNLDRNVRVGDALSGRAFDDEDVRIRESAAIGRMRRRYARATGKRKDELSRLLDRAERRHAIATCDRELATIARRRHDLVAARRGRDLFGDRYEASSQERAAAASLKAQANAVRASKRRLTAGGALPFSFPVHFSEIAARGGFSLVVGNPPWVRVHRIPSALRADFRRDFDVARHASWEPGALTAGAGRGFAAQLDVAALFIERATRLTRRGGAIALLVPVKLWRSLAGGGVRRWLAAETMLRRLEDHSEGPAAFDAAVYPSVVVAQRKRDASSVDTCDVSITVLHRGRSEFTWHASAAAIAFDDTVGAPYVIVPPEARRSFDRIRAAGVPLSDTVIGRPRLGVKSGCNEAFVVELLDSDETLAEVQSADGRRGIIEQSMLRPLIRGEELGRWSVTSRMHLVWPHDAHGNALVSLPEHVARWLAHWRHRLLARTDVRHRARWWSLFRVDGARNDRPRVVWSDVAREPRAAVLSAGDPSIPLNSCYVALCRDDVDAHALATLLNGPLAAAWLGALAEPARGGYRRYLGWTMSLLPLPRHWDVIRSALAVAGVHASRAERPSSAKLLEAALDAYGLARDDVAPLVAWMAP